MTIFSDLIIEILQCKLMNIYYFQKRALDLMGWEVNIEGFEKKLQANNLIIHRVDEPSGGNTTDNKAKDVGFVTNFIETVQVTVAPKIVVRLGKSELNKKRPIKVVLNSEEDKNKILINLKNLKDHEAFKGISITEDYTLNERKLI